MKRIIRPTTMAVIAVNQLAPQLLALLALTAIQFGSFSIGYLVFALASSVTLSTVSEAYARGNNVSDISPEPANYSAAATWISALFGLVAGLVFGLVAKSVPTGIVGSIAVALASRRTPIRYLEIRRSIWSKVLASESLSLLAFLGSWILASRVFDLLDAILLSWAIGGLCQWLLGTMRHFGTPKGALSWIRDHRDNIVPLLKDSMILDISSIGAPYVIAPVLGTASFGLYRAISNFAAPIRLLINLIRPQIAKRTRNELISPRSLIFVTIASAVFGAIASVVLLYIHFNPVGIEVIDGISGFWLGTGIFILGSTLGHYIYIVARIRASNRSLLLGRLFQSTVALVLPVGGAAVGSLSGAIWMYAIGTLLGAIGWLVICLRES